MNCRIQHHNSKSGTRTVYLNELLSIQRPTIHVNNELLHTATQFPIRSRTQSFIRTLNHFFKDTAAEDQRRRMKLAPPRRWNRNAGPPPGTASYMNYSSIKDEECRIVRIFVTIKFENHLFLFQHFYTKKSFSKIVRKEPLLASAEQSLSRKGECQDQDS